VTLLVGGRSLAENLRREIDSAPNIAVRYNVVVAGGAGKGRLESLVLGDRVSGVTETVPATALFVLIGAEPRTQWLPDDIARDRWGFVVAGTTSW
jgi:thioredoxin reductase (NADPH)